MYCVGDMRDPLNERLEIILYVTYKSQWDGESDQPRQASPGDGMEMT